MSTAVATRKSSQYSSAHDQQEDQGSALLERLRNTNFAMIESVRSALISQGVLEQEIPILATTCLVANIPPSVLLYSHNIPEILRIKHNLTVKGYRPKVDFYAPVFQVKQPIPDADGTPTSKKADAPTVVYMPSIHRLQANAEMHGERIGQSYYIETEVLRGEESLAAFKEAGLDQSHSSKGMVAAKTMLYTSGRGGQRLGSGKPKEFFGFYLPTGLYNGQDQPDWNERGKAKPNYGPAEIAKKRSVARAWLSITREEYPAMRYSIGAEESRVISLVQEGNRALTVAVQKAESEGIPLDEAIAGENIVNDHKDDQRHSAMIAQPKLSAEEEQNFYNHDVVDNSETTKISEKDGSFQIVDFLDEIVAKLTPEQTQYVAALRVLAAGGEFATERQASFLEQALDASFFLGEQKFGISCSQLLLYLLAGKDTLSVSVPMYNTLAKDIVARAGDRENKNFSQEKFDLVKGIAGLLSQQSQVESE